METLSYIPRVVLWCPRLGWRSCPGCLTVTVCTLLAVSYSHHQRTDWWCHWGTSQCRIHDWWSWPWRPAVFLAYRANGQYIMKDGSQLPVYNGRFRFIILGWSNAADIPKLNRFLVLFIGFVSYRVFSWLGYSWEWNCQAIWMLTCLLRKKSVDNGFAPVNKVLKAVSIL